MELFLFLFVFVFVFVLFLFVCVFYLGGGGKLSYLIKSIENEVCYIATPIFRHCLVLYSSAVISFHNHNTILFIVAIYF